MIRRTTKLCNKCNRRHECWSPTKILQEPRKRWLMYKGYRLTQTEAMRKGTQAHERLQKDIPTINKHFKKELRKGKKLTLQEVAICSPSIGMFGFIDKLEIQIKVKDKTVDYFITITDFKPFYKKNYLHQISYYGLLMNQKDCYFHYKRKLKTKDKEVFEPIKLYPDKLNIRKNIIIQIYDYNKKQITTRIPFVDNNIMDAPYNIYLINWLETARLDSLKPLEEIRTCKKCKKQKCEFYERFCARIGENCIPKTKQRYYGKKNLLIKTKPKKVGR